MIAGIPPTHTGPLIESGLLAGMPRGYAASLRCTIGVSEQTLRASSNWKGHSYVA
jgi:hypothetical protein